MTREELWTRALARGDYLAHGHIRRREYVEVIEPDLHFPTRFWIDGKSDLWLTGKLYP